MLRNDAVMSMSNDEVIFYVNDLKENIFGLLHASTLIHFLQ